MLQDTEKFSNLIKVSLDLFHFSHWHEIADKHWLRFRLFSVLELYQWAMLLLWNIYNNNTLTLFELNRTEL